MTKELKWIAAPLGLAPAYAPHDYFPMPIKHETEPMADDLHVEDAPESQESKEIRRAWQQDVQDALNQGRATRSVDGFVYIKRD